MRSRAKIPALIYSNSKTIGKTNLIKNNKQIVRWK
jgi:hypothetical protein